MMWPFSFFRKSARVKRRLRSLLVPSPEERFFHIATFGNIQEDAQRIAALQHRYNGSIRCVFLIFEDGSLSHFVQGPQLHENEYKTLLSDLEQKHNRPLIESWTNIEQALLSIPS